MTWVVEHLIFPYCILPDGIFEVLSTNGDTYLGGDDFDNAIVRFWMQQLNLSDIEVKENKTLSQKLRLLAEEAKICFK